MFSFVEIGIYAKYSHWEIRDRYFLRTVFESFRHELEWAN